MESLAGLQGKSAEGSYTEANLHFIAVVTKGRAQPEHRNPSENSSNKRRRWDRKEGRDLKGDE